MKKMDKIIDRILDRCGYVDVEYNDQVVLPISKLNPQWRDAVEFVINKHWGTINDIVDGKIKPAKDKNNKLYFNIEGFGMIFPSKITLLEVAACVVDSYYHVVFPKSLKGKARKFSRKNVLGIAGGRMVHLTSDIL